MQNTDIHIDTSGSMDLRTCYPSTLSPNLNMSLSNILDRIGAVIRNDMADNEENLRFRIESEGIIDTDEDENVITGTVEYELRYPFAIYKAKRCIDILREHKKDIIGFHPNSVKYMSEELPEWQDELFAEGWIPIDENDDYCKVITDIRTAITCENNVFEIIPKETVRILSTPCNGWSAFTLEEFHAPMSYIDDVPILLLEFIRDFKLNGHAVVTFDCEGYDFTLVFTCNYDSYAITDENEPELYRFDTTQPVIMNSIIRDIEDDLDS